MKQIAQPPTQPVAHQRNGLVSLHPGVYRVFLAMALLFVLGSWSFFGGGYSGVAATIVTLFVGFAIAIVAALVRIWRGHHDLREDPGAPTGSFQEWLHGDVRTLYGRLNGRSAAVAALTPIVAGGVGMALLAIAHYVAVG